MSKYFKGVPILERGYFLWLCFSLWIENWINGIFMYFVGCKRFQQWFEITLHSSFPLKLKKNAITSNFVCQGKLQWIMVDTEKFSSTMVFCLLPWLGDSDAFGLGASWISPQYIGWHLNCPGWWYSSLVKYKHLRFDLHEWLLRVINFKIFWICHFYAGLSLLS